MSRLGQIIVLSAPSGAGKSTLVRRLRQEFPTLAFSVSCTTRQPRPGERHGHDYHFLERVEFEARIADQGFAEWAEVHGNLYGTPRKETFEMLEAGRDVLFDVDVQGALQLRAAFGFGCYAFILPPSRQELVRRLEGRGHDAPEVIARRLTNAAGEIAQAGKFDFLIVNDDLDRAYDELRAVYLAATLTPDRHPTLLADLLAQWGKRGTP